MKTITTFLEHKFLTEIDISVDFSSRADLCDFQSNAALKLAKQMQQPARVLAEKIVLQLSKVSTIEKVEVAGPGFINFDIKASALIDYVDELQAVLFTGFKHEAPKKIIMDYGGPNVAKPLHVGHMRPAFLGESLKRTARFLGHEVISDVHLGDWGLPIGLIIQELIDSNADLAKPFNGFNELASLYPKAREKADASPEFYQQAKDITEKLQKGEEPYLGLWEKIVSVSVEEIKKGYGALNVSFDLWLGESDTKEIIPKLLAGLVASGHLIESEGAMVIALSDDSDSEIPPIILVKADGSYLYGTTDLATIVQRVTDYNPDEIIYVVDSRQQFHFKQVFLSAYQACLVSVDTSLEHVEFGMILDDKGNAFSSREGADALIENLFHAVESSVFSKMSSAKASKVLEGEEREKVARLVALAAMKVGDLMHHRNTDYRFSVEKFTELTGNTGPYIQYTALRAKSLVSKARTQCDIVYGFQEELDCETKSILLKVAKFTNVVNIVYEERSPHLLCEYCFDLCAEFNQFWNKNRILVEPDPIKRMNWINICDLTSIILLCCLDLLGIETPEAM